MSEDKDLREIIKDPNTRAVLEEFATTLVVNAIAKADRDEDDSEAWNVYIEYRSPGKYAVKDRFVQYDADGLSAHESLPSSRTEDSLERFRFDLPTAVDIAYKLAEKVSVNGITARGYVVWNKAKKIHDEAASVGKLPEDVDARSLAFYDILETFPLDEQLQQRVDVARKYIRDNPRNK